MYASQTQFKRFATHTTTHKSNASNVSRVSYASRTLCVNTTHVALSIFARCNTHAMRVRQHDARVIATHTRRVCDIVSHRAALRRERSTPHCRTPRHAEAEPEMWPAEPEHLWPALIYSPRMSKPSCGPKLNRAQSKARQAPTGEQKKSCMMEAVMRQCKVDMRLAHVAD